MWEAPWWNPSYTAPQVVPPRTQGPPEEDARPVQHGVPDSCPPSPLVVTTPVRVRYHWHVSPTTPSVPVFVTHLLAGYRSPLSTGRDARTPSRTRGPTTRKLLPGSEGSGGPPAPAPAPPRSVQGFFQSYQDYGTLECPLDVDTPGVPVAVFDGSCPPTCVHGPQTWRRVVHKDSDVYRDVRGPTRSTRLKTHQLQGLPQCSVVLPRVGVHPSLNPSLFLHPTVHVEERGERTHDEPETGVLVWEVGHPRSRGQWVRRSPSWPGQTRGPETRRGGERRVLKCPTER